MPPRFSTPGTRAQTPHGPKWWYIYLLLQLCFKVTDIYQAFAVFQGQFISCISITYYSQFNQFVLEGKDTCKLLSVVLGILVTNT